MPGPGLYYVPPPVFIGGHQPYAPAQPVISAPSVSVPANAYIRQVYTLHEIVQAWQPGGITILWSGPAGAGPATPPPPLPPASTSTGLQQLVTTLQSWEPVPLPVWLVFPRHIPLPAAPLQTAPSLNTGQLQLFTVLRAWEPVPRVLLLRQGGIQPTRLGGGRLIGPNRLART